MRRRTISIAFAVGLLAAGGCKRKDEPNKLIGGGLPINSTIDITAARAIQQFMLLKRDSLSIVIPVINRLAIPDATFSELTGPVGMDYSFTFSNGHYGNAGFTVKFIDNTPMQIDPIAFRSSTTTLKTVDLTTSGSSDLYTYTESLTVTLEIAGDVASTKRLTGTSTFNGSGYSITFTFAAPGSASNQDGLIDGTVSGTGTGPSGAFSATLTYSTDHTADGALQWEGESGGIHLANDGRGFIITDHERILID